MEGREGVQNSLNLCDVIYERPQRCGGVGGLVRGGERRVNHKIVLVM